MVPRFISLIKWSQERMHKAMMVRVGFRRAGEENPTPSMTKRFLRSCDRWNRLSPEPFGSLPLRAVPSS